MDQRVINKTESLFDFGEWRSRVNKMVKSLINDNVTDWGEEREKGVKFGKKYHGKGE